MVFVLKEDTNAFRFVSDMSVIRVKQKNKNALKDIVRSYDKDYVLRVGFPASKTGGVQYPDGERVVDIAAQNEFGSSEQNIPSRPFMALSKKDATDVLRETFRKLTPKINREQETKLQAIETVGPFVADVFKNTITELTSPPNSPFTIAMKGSSNPLIDTGLMRQTLTYEVKEDKGER